MKVQIRDRAPFERLNPVDLATYLSTNGWTEVEHQPEKFSAWVKGQNGEGLEVLLPLRRTLSDFVLRMADAVGTLAAAEGRSQLEVLADIQTAGADVIRVRFRHADAAEGLIPLERGEALVESTRELFVAGACAAVARRPYFASFRPEEVRQFVQHLRLGPGERGSYVLTVLSRVTPQLRVQQGTLFDEPEPPFERRAVVALHRALATLRGAVELAAANPQADVFQNAVQHGVSANLCAALVNMNGPTSQPADELRFGFTWARSRPVGESEGSPREVGFPSDYFPLIAEAARLLKAVAPREEQELRGYVVKLQTTDEKGPPAGPVTLSTVIDGRQRKVTVSLSAEEHQKAIQAYRDGLEIACRGVLTKSGQTWTLLNPGTITLVGDE